MQQMSTSLSWLESYKPLSVQAASSATIPPLTLQKARQLIPVAGEMSFRLQPAAVYILKRAALRQLAVCAHGCRFLGAGLYCSNVAFALLGLQSLNIPM